MEYRQQSPRREISKAGKYPYKDTKKGAVLMMAPFVFENIDLSKIHSSLLALRAVMGAAAV